MIVVRAPGRVNLIGEHTDYTGGFVMPAAIHLATRVEALPLSARLLRVESSAYPGVFEFPVDDPAPAPRRDWTDYVHGVAIEIERAGIRLAGTHLRIHSEVPLGSGLSSSASLEVAVGAALLRASGAEMGRVPLALLCQRAENGFAGANCGIMDQFSVCCSEEGHALLIDCRSLESRPLPLDPRVRLVVCNSMVRHAVAGSGYTTRREECEEGQRLLGVAALRDATLPMLEAFAASMPEPVLKRCRHVISENARVLRAAEALESGDVSAFGRLMSESHRSLRDDFEASCEELDILVDLATGMPGVYGARMTGGGFGGCTVNLVAEDAVDQFKTAMAQRYFERTGLAPDVFVCRAASGVSVLEG